MSEPEPINIVFDALAAARLLRDCPDEQAAAEAMGKTVGDAFAQGHQHGQQAQAEHVDRTLIPMAIDALQHAFALGAKAGRAQAEQEAPPPVTAEELCAKLVEAFQAAQKPQVDITNKVATPTVKVESINNNHIEVPQRTVKATTQADGSIMMVPQG